MKKMPTLFVRDWNGDRSLVTEEINPECQWVIDGEGIATPKWDGICVKIENNRYYKRYDAKHGKTPPAGFIPAQPEPDENSGHWPGWLLVDASKGEDKWFIDALIVQDIDQAEIGKYYVNGTYELIGPKIGGNPHESEYHTLIKHGSTQMPLFPHDYHGIKQCFESSIAGGVGTEGVVWHHKDGRMAKVKARDFGLPWPLKKKK